MLSVAAWPHSGQTSSLSMTADVFTGIAYRTLQLVGYNTPCAQGGTKTPAPPCTDHGSR